MTTPIPSIAEMRAWEGRSRLQGDALLNAAGTALGEAIAQRLAARRPMHLLVGPGANGADALIAGTWLVRHGYEVSACPLLGTTPRIGPLLDQFVRAGGQLSSHEVPSQFGERRGVILDGIFGIGQRLPLPEDLLPILPERGRYEVWAVDLPTGIDGDTGEVSPSAVLSTTTFAMHAPKRGLYQYPARALCGEIVTVAITDEALASRYHLLDRASLPPIPARPPDAHKGDAGRVLIVGGSQRLPGAPLLAARAALRVGAGLVWVTSNDTGGTPELMLIPRQGSYLGAEVVDEIAALLSGREVVVLGPGLGRTPELLPLVERLVALVAERGAQLVIDADALTLLADARSPFPGAIITPHSGEAARLLNTSVAEVQRDRYRSAEQLLDLTNAGVVLLKGAGSIIASRSGGRVIPISAPALATAGSGDVLSGVISAFLAQGLAPFDAVCRGAFLHAAVAEASNRPLIASDLIELLGRTAWSS